MNKMTAAALFVTGFLSLTGPATAAGAAPSTGVVCGTLAGMTIPGSAIGLPTGGATVTSAVMVAADAPDNRDGEYCRILGAIEPRSPAAPKMLFQVNLPTRWNGKAAQYGGGGSDGVLITGLGPARLQPTDAPDPLRQGYVTLGGDSGHQGSNGFDMTFGLNDEALLNYGRESVKKVHDVAVAIVKARYGSAPRRFYFIGGSQGGHEALDAAARYPADYDGVVVNFPAYNLTMLHMASWNVGKALYDNGGTGWLSPVKTRLLTDAVYKACDGLDGLKDGIISDVKACDAAFSIATVRATLRCPDGADKGDTCLSDAQIAAVDKISSSFKPGVVIAGQAVFPRWALLEGALFQGRSTFGVRPVPVNPPATDDALLYRIGAGTIKYIITRQPGFDALTFNVKNYGGRVEQVGGIMDVSDIDLSAFRRKGGKIILVHGLIDDYISFHNSIALYEHQRATQGSAKLDSFLRFYLIPGFGHGYGIFNAKYKGLDALSDWVEAGHAPGQLTAIDDNPGAHRERPMCRYPTWPRYKGSGSPDRATSFACVR